jgi:hypothetical protein
MAIYQAAFSIAGVNAANAVLFNLLAASTDRATLREVGFFTEVAPTNPPQYGLMRMNAAGTGAITNATAEKADPADGAAATALQTAWATTRPTVTGGLLRSASVLAAIGNGVIYTFPGNMGIVVPVSTGLCGVVSNAAGATVGTHRGYVVWEE